MEEDSINLLIYSSEKLANVFNNTKDKYEAISTHIKTANYPKIEEFKEGLEWFNTSEALTFKKQLKGKIVLLDFFTYCCINCMHILPDLEALENEFSIEDGLVIIGIHSAKFQNEKQSDNILAAVQRYNISHPVVNDADLHMWKSCDVFSWPTLLLIGPFANPLIMYVGEGNRDNLGVYIKHALDYYKSIEAISNHSLPISSANHLLSTIKEPLLFPGKIVSYVDENNAEILAISDTGNHRVLLVKNDGAVLKQIGSGKKGFKDGIVESAEFHSPQGLAFLTKDTLLVADTENHSVRKVNLKLNTVETIIGTGVQGFDKIGGNTGKQQIISSPWDLSLYKQSESIDVLLIAMAGTHQIWAYFFDDTVWWKKQKYTATTCICIAGSGNEENRNNVYPLKASFAQPSGLAVCNKKQELYIADSESSSIRRILLSTGKVEAVVGGDRDPCNLFAYGDRDGTSYDAKLQHVLGLAVNNNEDKLFIADTYNHKLKKVVIGKNDVNTLVATDINDVLLDFNEPGGLTVSVIENKLYVADTNNHCIKTVVISNDTRIVKVEKLNLRFDHEDVDFAKQNDQKTIYKYKPINVTCQGGKLFVKVSLNFLNETSLTADAPQKWYCKLPNSNWNCTPAEGKNVTQFEIVVIVPPINKQHLLDFNLAFYMCSLNVCMPKNFIIRLPINPVGKIASEYKANVSVNIDSKEIFLY